VEELGGQVGGQFAVVEEEAAFLVGRDQDPED
jgi:hypothetical protein